jgi:hypothetical protein
MVTETRAHAAGGVGMPRNGSAAKRELKPAQPKPTAALMRPWGAPTERARLAINWAGSGTPAGGTCVSSKQSCAARLSRRAAAEVRSLLGGPGSGNSVWFGRSERVKIRIDRAAAVEVRDVNG